MLSEGIQNDWTTNGRTKPKTRAKATTSTTNVSKRPPFLGRRRLPERPDVASISTPRSSWKRFPLTLEGPDVRGRPEDHERLALDVLEGHRPEKARVAGVGPVVAHREDVARGYRGGAVEAVVRESGVDVGLFLALAVHVKGTALHL